LHNADVIAKLDVRVGDTVWIEKGGEIIPKIVGVDDTQPRGKEETHGFIAHCPECQTALVREEGEAQHYCPNSAGCRPQRIGKLEHFVSRKAMNIEGLGTETLEGLMRRGMIQTVADLYSLPFGLINELEMEWLDEETGETRKRSLQRKSLQNLEAAIEQSKQIPFERVLYALGIRHVGETTAKKLAKKWGSFEKLSTCSVEELSCTDEVGPRIAESIVDYCRQEENVQLVKQLKTAGLCFETTDKLVQRSDTLAGKTLVVSGVFGHYSRDGIKEVIESHGGKVSGSISSKTTYLVAGEDMGPAKRAKAESLGVVILNENEFRELIRE